MRVSDINPHIRYARIHRAFLDTPKRDSVCYDCRLFFIENASGTFIINGVPYAVTGMQAFFLPPKTVYRLNFKQDSNFKITVLDFDLVNDFCHLEKSLGTATVDTFDEDKTPEYTLPTELCEPIVRQTPEIRQPLFECTELFLSRPPFFLESASALLKLCLIELIRKSRKSTARTVLCDEVVKYIHETYSNSALTNGDIAARFNYNPYHLSHILKEQTGKSLHRYLMNYRIRMAKNYLLTTDLGIEEISWRTGFCTAAYFVKIFRENTGMTPKKYRNTKFHAEL